MIQLQHDTVGREGVYLLIEMLLLQNFIKLRRIKRELSGGIPCKRLVVILRL